MTYLLIFGCTMILILLIMMLFSHSQAMQRFAVMELLLIIVLAAVGTISLWKTKAFTEKQYFSIYQLYINEAQAFARDMEAGNLNYTEEIKGELESSLEAILERSLPITRIGEDTVSYVTAAIYERTGEQKYAPWIYRSVREGYLSPEDCNSYITQFAEEAISSETLYYQKTNTDTAVLFYTGTGMIVPRFVILTEIPLNPLIDTITQLEREFGFLGLIVLLAGTVLLAFIVFMQGRQMRALVKQVVSVAEGKEDWNSLQNHKKSLWVESNEIRCLKNSLTQISSDMARMNYEKYKTLQAYYRFAPKKIEEIFGKQSILEVEPSDRTQLVGTLAFVAFPEYTKMGEQQYIKTMSGEFAALGEKQKQQGGILLSGNTDLTTLQVLFREETQKAIRFGIDLATQQEEQGFKKFFVLLHRTSFMYGVAGNDDQAFTYVLSREMKVLEKYMTHFRALGIRMAVTDSVFEMIERDVEGRYIGYLEEEGGSFKIYEILDACPVKERRAKASTLERFEKALNLFYRGDYYLGRNLFTEVLKECPGDEVAKWYLFLCEKCLNAEFGKDISCALFSE